MALPQQLAMDPDELASFLAGDPELPCYATVSSLRRDGSPIGVPLGYLYQDGWIYFSMNPATWGTLRIRRDLRVCVTVYNDRYPVRFVVITGEAEEFPDADHAIERKKFMRNMGHVGEEIDLDAYFALHEEGGPVVFRVRVDAERVASMDATKAADPETGQMRTPEELNQVKR
ncbi:MAG TPA: pyridoxamine 5'-phosphate oxidase family protein [Acidimicrobiales bacterium]|jgi:nitroimidazol reductase NimA-like FMN-containing flavoprotein (pyridoxamine 5'-phosphate oxidase superfamily)|nr:pyridoxamine 5'-phosphate oxidase family protein [Acidimicrobiales bacterium]